MEAEQSGWVLSPSQSNSLGRAPPPQAATWNARIAKKRIKDLQVSFQLSFPSWEQSEGLGLSPGHSVEGQKQEGNFALRASSAAWHLVTPDIGYGTYQSFSMGQV